MLVSYVAEHRQWFVSYKIHNVGFFNFYPAKPTRKQLSKWRKTCKRNFPEGVYHDKIFSMPDEQFIKNEAPH